MISWIVASHEPRILNEYLLPTLEMHGDDELVLVQNAPSITLAYAEGQWRATQPVKCYIHHDVRIMDIHKLRAELIYATQEHGLVGVIGSRESCFPWWQSTQLLGSVMDSRLGVLDYGPGGECAAVDGLLLASRMRLGWDIGWGGWHGYDHDISQHVRALGRDIWCLDNGSKLIAHWSDSAFDLAHVDGWAKAEEHYRGKWL